MTPTPYTPVDGSIRRFICRNHDLKLKLTALSKWYNWKYLTVCRISRNNGRTKSDYCMKSQRNELWHHDPSLSFPCVQQLKFLSGQITCWVNTVWGEADACAITNSPSSYNILWEQSCAHKCPAINYRESFWQDNIFLSQINRHSWISARKKPGQLLN